MKWEELKDLDLKGFKAFSKEGILVDGEHTAIYELTKGDYNTGFMYVRAKFADLETLCRLEMTDINTYKRLDGSLSKFEPLG